MHWILRMGGVLSSMSLHFFLKIISALQRVLCTQIYRKYCKNSCSNTKLSESLASSSFAWVFSKSSQPNSTINYLHFVHRPHLEVQSTFCVPTACQGNESALFLENHCCTLPSPNSANCFLWRIQIQIHEYTNANTNTDESALFLENPTLQIVFCNLTWLACKIHAYIHKCEAKRFFRKQP